MAAVAAIVFFNVAGVGGGFTWITLGQDARIETLAGQQRTQALPDGSVMAVNVASHVSYVVRDDRRRVKIHDGEAAFNVKADKQRPFVVEAGEYEIRAVGTAFNVRSRDGVVEVAVGEGRVEICAASASASAAATAPPFVVLTAGQLLRFPVALSERQLRSAVPVAVPPLQISEWRMRVVTYEDAPLSEVIADFNRYFPQKLLIEPDLADERVTVRLQVDDRARAIDTLASLLNVNVRETPQGEMLAN
jgi:transmembrane sensor